MSKYLLLARWSAGMKILAKTMAFFEISDPALRNNQAGGFGYA